MLCFFSRSFAVCTQVASVTPGSVAARHGVRALDLILSMDGRHLLASSEMR